jgi:hypothetical protein
MVKRKQLMKAEAAQKKLNEMSDKARKKLEE